MEASSTAALYSARLLYVLPSQASVCCPVFFSEAYACDAGLNPSQLANSS